MTSIRKLVAPSATRNTRQKTAVEDALKSNPQFISAQELHETLVQSGEEIGLTTVYRILNQLVERGSVDAITVTGNQTLYRDCSQNHHHHLVCRKCGKTVELQAAEIEAWAKKIGKSHKFKDIEHRVELIGTCQRCD